jgi:osmotically-inducible protein OsmY
MTRPFHSSAVQPADAEIFAAARQALDSRFGDAPRIDIHVEHGYVTLTGSVAWPAQSEDAERCVRGVLGVIGVINSIAVSKPHASAHETPA